MSGEQLGRSTLIKRNEATAATTDQLIASAGFRVARITNNSTHCSLLVTTERTAICAPHLTCIAPWRILNGHCSFGRWMRLHISGLASLSREDSILCRVLSSCRAVGLVSQTFNFLQREIGGCKSTFSDVLQIC